MNLKNKLKTIKKSWYFLGAVILIYLLLAIFNKNLFLETFNFFISLIIKLAPIFIIVFVLMALSNYFITPQFALKHLTKKGIRKWFFVIIGGILSSGPAYMWYPLLSDLRNKGLSNGLIVCFLYNRAIKIPFLPLAIAYFNWKYVLILTFVMVLVSVIQGILFDKIMKGEYLKVAIASKGKTFNSEIGHGKKVPYYFIFEQGRLVEIIENPFTKSKMSENIINLLSEKRIGMLIASEFGSSMESKLKEKGIRFKRESGEDIEEILKKVFIKNSFLSKKKVSSGRN